MGVSLGFSLVTLAVTVFNLALMGIGVYALILLIKALKIYIKNNS